MTSLNLKESALLEFIAETEEMLERTSLHLDEIEKGMPVDQVIDEMYRDIHSIKGSSSLFGCPQMGTVAHAIESSLDPIRNHLSELSSDLVESIYRGLDLIKEIVEGVKETKSEPNVQEKLAALIPVIVGNTITSVQGDFSPLRDAPLLVDDLESELEAVKKMKINESKTKPQAEVKTAKDMPMKESIKPVEKAEKPAVVQNEKPSDASLSASRNSDSAKSETLRVSVGILDKLMNLVGELVLIRNQYLQFGNSKNENEQVELNQRLNIVTGELQEEVMKTRMQPIGTILTKYHRVVRDLSKDLGKEVDLVLEGTETELDKTLLEAIRDPLMHIVRNSVDHGLESPDARLEIGKPRIGKVKINSYHEGGQVIVEVVDDGRGLDREKISEKIIEKGLSTAEKLQNLSDREVFLFIFAPGFSTAERVSNVSGRGVGMDVVKTNIERIGGMIDLNSVKGQGTTLRLKIPLTLAIIPALIVKSGAQRFGIPQVKLVELVRVEGGDNDLPQIEFLQGRPVYRLRGQLLPLVDLNSVLQLKAERQNSNVVNIVVLHGEGGNFGLIVDEIENSADIVIKPLMQFIKDNSIYSGATVMGDGSVALTIDVVELANHVGIFDSSEQDVHSGLDQSNMDVHNTDITEYLLLDVGMPGKFAMPLCLVNRLEEFSADQVEMSGEQRVIQYRDSLLPIISVPEFLGVPPSPQADRENISVIVVHKSNRYFGIEVEKIVDIFRCEREVDTGITDRLGIMGSILVGEDIIAVLDVFKIIHEFLGVSFEVEESAVASVRQPSTTSHAKKILLVDDNAFFRNHVKQLLTNAGFLVTVAKHGQEGYELLKSHASEISAVVSDIEMPILDGYGMAQKIKQDDQLKDIPLMAITTRYRKADIERGLDAGFEKYLEKLDPDQLLAEMNSILNAA